MEQDYEGVTLVTANSSKGMEWPIVYLSLTSFDNDVLHKITNKEEVEERRRVMYVAITRAMNELYITGEYVAYCKKDDYTYNQFLREIFTALDKEEEYVPIDPEEAVREKKRAEERRLKDKERREAKKKADVSRLLLEFSLNLLCALQGNPAQGSVSVYVHHGRRWLSMSENSLSPMS